MRLSAHVPAPAVAHAAHGGIWSRERQALAGTWQQGTAGRLSAGLHCGHGEQERLHTHTPLRLAPETRLVRALPLLTQNTTIRESLFVNCAASFWHASHVSLCAQNATIADTLSGMCSCFVMQVPCTSILALYILYKRARFYLPVALCACMVGFNADCQSLCSKCCRHGSVPVWRGLCHFQG
jgi:hypothetical protein